MRVPPRSPLWTAVAACALAIAVHGPAAADEGRPTPAPVVFEQGPDASADKVAPAATAASKPLRRVPLVLRTIPAAPAADKGSTFMDGGVGLAAPGLAEHERIKLARAREAIEASRAAGLLFGVAARAHPIERSREELEREKLERLHTPAKRDALPPAAGVGEGLPSLQKVGPAELSEIERLKLDAFLRGEVYLGPPAKSPAVEKPRATPERRTDRPADEKGGR